MVIRKADKQGTWMVQYSYTDWQGNKKRTTKRGFKTKREAMAWYRAEKSKLKPDFDMNFADFLKKYLADAENRVRKSTMNNKVNMIEKHILPYFKSKKVSSIRAIDIREWQNHLISQNYSETYLKTINNQLSAVMNYAVRYYDLPENPCKKAGSMGSTSAGEMNFWQRSEFEKFIECVADKKQTYIAFLVLFWTGLRVGELLALTTEDIDIQGKAIRVNKSYQRIKGQDVITDPKTKRSFRTVAIPEFLAADLQDYLNGLYGITAKDRIFPFTKYRIEQDLKRGIKISGLKPIRVHDLRHSHAAMLVFKGVGPLQIRDRLGHADIRTTLNTYGHLYPNSDQLTAQYLHDFYLEELK